MIAAEVVPVRLGPASTGGALFIFVQKLAHLLDGQGRILAVERLLAFALIEKRPLSDETAASDAFLTVVHAARFGNR